MPTDICDCDTDYKGAAATCNHNPGNQKSECGHRLQFSSSAPAAWQINAHPRTVLRKTSPALSIGVPGAFFRGGQQFLSAKNESCSAKKYPLRGGQILQFCSAKLM